MTTNKPDRLLVIGGTGFLGSQIMKNWSSSFNCTGTYFSGSKEPNLLYLDATNLDETEKIIAKIKPTVIFNCAGLTDVDKCQLEPELSKKLNIDIPKNLALISEKCGIKFLHLSTDNYVARQNKRISESDLIDTINIYGFHKKSAEEEILAVNKDSIVIRCNFFGVGARKRPSFLNWILELVEFSSRIRGVSDVYFTPIGIQTLINISQKLMQENYSGIINISSDERISKYEFILKVLKSIDKLDYKVEQVALSELQLMAPRPLDMSLSNLKVKQLLKIELPSIDHMLKEELSGYRKFFG
jgi:dTDP-4-dehydrorhamnose reductase